MPLLDCEVQASEDYVKLKMLIDSGSAVDLISDKMAQKLKKLGHAIEKSGRRTVIKVANGKTSRLKEAMTLTLRLGDEVTEPITFFILDDLPFEMILGHCTCRKWKRSARLGQSELCNLAR